MRRHAALRAACWLALASAAIPLAACAGGGADRPSSLGVYAEPAFATPALAAATELLAGQGISVAPAPAPEQAGLALAGFDVITVATNHVKDCGRAACGDQAFFDTLANLRAQGIAPVGGGADLSETRQPGIVTVDGVSFAFLGYDQIAPYYHAEPDFAGTAPLEEAFLREDVATAAQEADVVVVLPQWGVEYTADPTLDQQALAAAAIESGADLIIGNHPHWVQASEVIDGVFVAYALGNFVFDQDWSLETQQGVVLDVAFHGSAVKGIEYYPVRIIDEHQPVFAEPDEARQILDRIWTASAALEVGLP